MEKDILFLHSPNGNRLTILRNAIIAVIDKPEASISYKRSDLVDKSCQIIVISGKTIPVNENYDTVMDMWVVEPEQTGFKAIEKLQLIIWIDFLFSNIYFYFPRK